MVIQIRLSDRVEHTPAELAHDSLNRTWRGYDPSVSDEQLWEHNRGRWPLSEARVANEKYATFVYADTVVAVYRIDDHEHVSDPGPRGTKIALIGRPLPSTHPVHRHLFGRPAMHTSRNAVNYVPDPTIENCDRTPTSSRAFLLTWNPDKWEWGDLNHDALDTEDGLPVAGSWATGNRTSGIRPGDRVFLLKQGTQGRGLIGSGEAVDYFEDTGPDDEIIYTDTHWDGSGAQASYVDVLWDRLLTADDLFPLHELQTQFPTQNWTPLAGGNEIRPGLLDELEVAWSRHIGGLRARPTGQGLVSNTAQRKAIEDAAQDWLMKHYRDAGWTVKDVRFSGPYDALATKNGTTLYLEAKGTQSRGDSVFVTRGEVEHARRHAGSCVIGIWSGMRFAQDGTIDPYSGETVIKPFDPDTGTLTAVQYRWELDLEA